MCDSSPIALRNQNAFLRKKLNKLVFSLESRLSAFLEPPHRFIHAHRLLLDLRPGRALGIGGWLGALPLGGLVLPAGAVRRGEGARHLEVLVHGLVDAGLADERVLVLVSMAAFLAAATQAPITASVIVMEMTRSQNMMFHLLAATLLASSIVVFTLVKILPGDVASYMMGMNATPEALQRLRAEVDAVLGAIAEGDIRAHFPTSDPQWKGAASEIFLAHACKLVRDRGGVIAHIDATVICEAPKVGPHRDAIREALDKLGTEPPAQAQLERHQAQPTAA